jgi:hypothetical protein
MNVCEIIDFEPGDGDGVEVPCKTASAGVDENGCRVCLSHGQAMQREGFQVTWDSEPVGGSAGT